MNKTIFFFILCLASFTSEAQFSRYIITLKDKGTNPFALSNPSAYLSDRAIQRRLRYNIPVDSTDLPITPRYLDSIRQSGSVTILNVSKWLNQVAIQTNDAIALSKISSFPFVSGVSPIAARPAPTQASDKFQIEENIQESELPSAATNANDFYDYGRSGAQVKIHRGEFLHNHGFRGKNMQMAVLDAGFLNYLTLPTFDSIRINNQILGTWDFVANEASVNEDYLHGMQCLSTIAANLPGVFVGQAPEAGFYLFRTEDVFTEYPIEEQNWAAGMERADSLGVDITSTSLGYNLFDNAVFNHTYADMNGNTTIGARIADLGAKKGMMVVVAAGNEGASAWHYIMTPGDADSAMTVGAVDSLGNVAGFSSYGPTADGRVKPDLAAVGWNAIVAQSSTGQPVFSSGTSFACPNLAGITTCLMQAFPEVSNMGIMAALKASATRSSNPDNRVGFGIPDVKKSFVLLQKQLFSRQVSLNDCSVSVHLNVKSDNTMPVVIERKLPGANTYTEIHTFNTTGEFIQRGLDFADDISIAGSGLINYRFRMDIAADTSYYLDSASVAFGGVCIPAINDVIIPMPKPAITDNLKVIIKRTTPVKYTILIYNSIGQRVYSASGIQAAGTGVNNISMNRFGPGIYVVSVLLDNKRVVSKKILKH